MLVTFTNAGSTDLYLSQIYRQLAAGESVQTHRTVGDLDGDQVLKALVAAGTITLAFAEETGDDSALGFDNVLVNYSNAARPAATAVPIYTAIYNTDDNFVNVSDGTNWRDPAGNVT
jgi:hypothetical protein